MKTLKRLATKEEQIKLIQKIVFEEFNNEKLIQTITEEFGKHKLNINVIYNVLQGGKTVERFVNPINQVGLMEYVAFVKGAYLALDWSGLKPERIFKEEDLLTYSGFSNEEVINKTIKLKHFKKQDELTFLGDAPVSDIAEWWSNDKIFYNQSTQREAKYKTLGRKDFIIRELDIDKDKVNEIKEAMKKGKYFSDTIVLNLRIIDNEFNEHQKEVTQVFDDIYDIEITPNYNLSSNRTTIVDILDGAHRIVACNEANREYKEEFGVDLDLKLDVKLVSLDINDARKFVKQLFERSDTNKEWLENIVEDDFGIVAEYIIDNSSLLKNNVATTRNEMALMKNALTTKGIIKECVEGLELPVNNKSASQKIAKNTAYMLDNLIECIKDKLNYNTIDEVKKNTIFLSYYMFVPYLIVAYKMRNSEDKIYLLDEIAEKIIENKDEFRDLAKYKKNSFLQKYKTTTEILSEVLRNV